MSRPPPRRPSRAWRRQAGWGRIVLSASQFRAGTAWTDEGTARQEQGLKHRAASETRTIPIPIPRYWSGCSAPTSRGFGATSDGRVFQAAQGGILPDSGYNEVWDQARREALTPAQYRSNPVTRGSKSSRIAEGRNESWP